MLGATLQVVRVQLGRRITCDDDEQRVGSGLRPPRFERGFYGGVLFVRTLGALPEMLMRVGF